MQRLGVVKSLPQRVQAGCRTATSPRAPAIRPAHQPLHLPKPPYTDQHLFDGMATWSPENLLRMDEQFVVAVEIAFRRGLEDPDTAALTYDLRRRLP